MPKPSVLVNITHGLSSIVLLKVNASRMNIMAVARRPLISKLFGFMGFLFWVAMFLRPGWLSEKQR
jgi:hypothetical protein